MNQEISKNSNGSRSPGFVHGLDREAAQLPYENEDASVLLQQVIDASGSNIAVLDERQTILYVNRAWRQFACQSGLVADEYGVGCNYSELRRGTTAAAPTDAAAIETGIKDVINKREIEFKMEYRCTAVAEPVWFQIHAAAFRIHDGGGSMILVNHENITHEKLETESLIRDRERLRHLMGTTNIIPWEADAEDRTFTYIGEHAEQVFGYSLDSWTQPDFWINHVHPDDRSRAMRDCGKWTKKVDEYQLEYRMLASNGDIVWINDIVSVHEESGMRKTKRGFMIDVTERKQSEGTLRHLSGRLITAQEEERKRIARELHDDLNQQVALIAIELQQIGQTLENKTNGPAERIKGLQKKVAEISAEIHSMSYKLHPSKLEHLGLASALKSFCSEISESRGLCIEFLHDEMPALLSTDITLCVFRVAQEALQNAAKHSGASQISVVLSNTNASIELAVSDNGCGFESNHGKMIKGLGFISMKERLRLVNGTISIRSRPWHGTHVSISVPLADVHTLQTA